MLMQMKRFVLGFAFLNITAIAGASGFGVSGQQPVASTSEQGLGSLQNLVAESERSSTAASVTPEISSPGNGRLRLPTPAELQAREAARSPILSDRTSNVAAKGGAAGGKGRTGGGATSSVAQDERAYEALGDTPLSRQTFLQMLRNMMPLSPKQIHTLRSLFDKTQRAAAAYPGEAPPRPTSSVVPVNLTPGATPPVVRLGSGYISSLVFLDASGQPWPIQAYDLGDPRSFNIQWDQKHNSNTLLVQARSAYKPGNLAVMLKGQNTPVMVTLLPGQSAIDYRVDLRVPGFGPNAAPQMGVLPASGNPVLVEFLNGTPPQEAKTLSLSGGQGDIWSYQGRLFLRTPMTLLSPGWVSTMSTDCTHSGEGACTHAYELEMAPVLLASYRGKIIKLNIEGL